MSCQQASRYLTTNSNNSAQTNVNFKNLNNNQNNINIKGNRNTRGVIAQEDPYVFTESVSTTPPILFNTQKTRPRLSDLTSVTNIGKLQQQKLPLIETNQNKTQASFLSSTTITNTCATQTSKNNLNQSITGTATIKNNCNNKKLNNVCVVRPQLQTQKPHYHHFQHQHQNYISSLNEYDADLKSISPPPLYTPPTPSLWQTPLLLESITSTSGNTSSRMTNVVAQRSPKGASQTMPLMACGPTVQTVGSTTTTINPSLTTTAMAKVAPIVVHAPLAPPPPPPAQSPNQCLPPSKFHNHTLAQHLEKVECLKKFRKSTEVESILCNDNVKSIASPLKPSSPLPLSTSLTDSASSRAKHSENEDLNEIPVNVIFRMGVVSPGSEKSTSNIQFVKPQTETDTQLQNQPQPSPPPATDHILTARPSSPSTTQIKTIVNKNLSTPASKTNLTKQLIQFQQINTSSIPRQHLSAANTTTTTITTTTAINSQKNDGDNYDSKKSTTNFETSTKFITEDAKIIGTHIKKKSSTRITSKNRKLNTFSSLNLHLDLPYNWQMGCSTTKGAVAIVKMSEHNIDLDAAHLATAAGLPYCLQQYSLNLYNSCKYSSKMLGREERIALYKEELHREATQLMSIRSLQKLPLQLSKRRLLCVNDLLRKYRKIDENKKELPANINRCCINGCDAYTLEMASHCQQHVVYNAAQHVFLPCTAKFADNTQCRVPVFDITHDLPLCMEHARKRDAYNRQLYEQRPRKINTNPNSINESIIINSKVSAVNTNILTSNFGTIKSQNFQLDQRKLQQHSHVLQQLPSNDNSVFNKRQIVVNQQYRKRKMSVGFTVNPVGRPQKRVKKSAEKTFNTSTPTTTVKHEIPRLTSTILKRKSSTTSLESLASNSQHSTVSSTSQQTSINHRQQQQDHLHSVISTIGNATTTSLAPPALAPLSSGLLGLGLPQHLFSFGHDNPHFQHAQNQINQQQRQRINVNEKHSFSASANSTVTATTPTELKDFISQFSLISQKHPQVENSTADISLLNTNSNSNFTSSGMGSTSSLPTGDDFLTQDMLSICENSSASSVDTGLGGLSDPELMLGGPEDDIPLGDTHLLEEHDLENVLNSLPEDAFKELFTTVHQDESDEIERAIELADKHLKTLQQTIGSELGDFLDFSDDMLMDNGDICSGSTANSILDTTALFIEDANVSSTSVTAAANTTQGGGSVIGTDIRGLVQT